MAKRIPYTHEGAKEVRKLRKVASITARNLIKDLKRGNCHAAHGWMEQLNRINAQVPFYTRTIGGAPLLPSAGTLTRLRRVYGVRCNVRWRAGVIPRR